MSTPGNLLVKVIRKHLRLIHEHLFWKQLFGSKFFFPAEHVRSIDFLMVPMMLMVIRNGFMSFSNGYWEVDVVFDIVPNSSPESWSVYCFLLLSSY